MSKRFRIVLLRDVHGLGKKGDVLSVAPGYAKNALLPSGAAVSADAGSLRAAAGEAARNAKREQVHAQKEAMVRERLHHAQLDFAAPANAHGVLYGSITAERIAATFAQQGIPVEKKYIRISKPLRMAGAYWIDVVFPDGETVRVPATVRAAPTTRS